jgi:hypothetical protein
MKSNIQNKFEIISILAKITNLLLSDQPNEIVCRQLDVYMREDGVNMLSKIVPKLTIDKWVDNRATIFQLIAAFRRSSPTQEIKP